MYIVHISVPKYNLLRYVYTAMMAIRGLMNYEYCQGAGKTLSGLSKFKFCANTR